MPSVIGQSSKADLADFLNNPHLEISLLTRNHVTAIQTEMKRREKQFAEFTPRERWLRLQHSRTTELMFSMVLTWGTLKLWGKITPPATEEQQNLLHTMKRVCLRALLPLGAIAALIETWEEQVARRCATTALYVADLVTNARVRLQIDVNGTQVRVGSTESTTT